MTLKADPFPNRKRNNNWITPPKVRAAIEAEWGECYDPCPIGGSGGLEAAWPSPTFINPPWSNIQPWIHRAVREWQDGSTIIMLLPTCTYAGWYWRHIPEVRHYTHHLQYAKPEGGKPKHSIFGSTLVIYRGG